MVLEFIANKFSMLIVSEITKHTFLNLSTRDVARVDIVKRHAYLYIHTIFLYIHTYIHTYTNNMYMKLIHEPQ